MRSAVVMLLLMAALGCSAGQPPVSPSERAPVTQAPPPAQPAATEATQLPEHQVRRPLRYVALGDSLASGMDTIDAGRSYADEYARLLRRETGRRVQLTNLGVPGLNSADLLHALRSDEGVRTAVASADIVTWDIGGNDLIEAVAMVGVGGCGDSSDEQCLAEARSTFEQQWHAIVDELIRLRRSPRTRLRTFDLYSPFATVRGVRVERALEGLAAMNAIIRGSETRPGVEVAGVADGFAGENLAVLIDADGLHPTAAGHRLIAEQLLALDDW